MIPKYNKLVENGDICADRAQREALDRLAVLQQEISKTCEKKAGFLNKLFPTKSEIPKGLYIYGDVGRGKSMLMDLFFDTTDIALKRRVHFHAFMLEVHGRLHKIRNSGSDISDPVPIVAFEIAEKTKLLCFDEFQVTDITDAMILGRLFKELFKNKVIIVATSNTRPDNLYKDGLQRENFLPFIDLIKKNLNSFELRAEKDYRLSHLKSLETVYFTPLGKKSEKFLEKTFGGLTNNAEAKPFTIELKKRRLILQKTHGDVAYANFDELCSVPMGAADYIEIAKEFSTLIIADIPIFNAENKNEAKRFIHLIDELYEHKVKLICSAEVTADKLLSATFKNAEFKRTVSRLIEMQSEEYLKSAHI